MEQVNLTATNNRKPEYLEKISMGAAPVLGLDDGTTIAKSVAICCYFKETNPHPALRPHQRHQDRRESQALARWHAAVSSRPSAKA